MRAKARPRDRRVVAILGAMVLASVLLSGCSRGGPTEVPASSSSPTIGAASTASPLAPSILVSPSSSADATEEPSMPAPEPSIDLSPEATAPPVVGAPVTDRTRSGQTSSGTVVWKFVEPLVATPGSAVGGKILANLEAVLQSRLDAYDAVWSGWSDWKVSGAWNLPYVKLTTSYTLLAYARPASDASAGLLTIQLNYLCEAPFADSGPQWVDILSYDLETGSPIATPDLFIDPAIALQRLSAAARLAPRIAQWLTPETAIPAGLAPTARNYAMWAPTRDGLRITFPANSVAPAVAGTPSFTLPWTELRDVLKRGSYVDWYLASVK